MAGGIIMKRVYDFDKMDEINKLLNLDLTYIECKGYVDIGSADETADCDQYFDWMIIQLLDELSDEAVKNIVMHTFCVQYNKVNVDGVYLWETLDEYANIAAYSHEEAIEKAKSWWIEVDDDLETVEDDVEEYKWRAAEVIDGELQDWEYE